MSLPLPFPPIVDHVAQALNRLLSQYKGRYNLESLFTSIVRQIQDIEDTGYSLANGRYIATAVGVQLDLLGTLVNEARNGLDDTQYRLFLLGKIAENSSNATADKVAQTFAILLGSNQVQEQDLYPAAVGISAAGFLDPLLNNLVFDLVQASLGAGIRLEFLETYDPNEAFAFDGPFPNALGFGSTLDPLAGGKFAGLLVTNVPFAFASNDPFDGDLGFGSILDPVMGGNFQGM